MTTSASPSGPACAPASDSAIGASAARNGEVNLRRRDLEALIRGLSRQLADARGALLALDANPGAGGARRSPAAQADPMAEVHLDALPAPCVILGGEGTILAANRAYKALTSPQPPPQPRAQAAIGESARDLFDHASWGDVMDGIGRARRADRPITLSLRLAASHGGRTVVAAIAWYGVGETPAFLMTLLPLEPADEDVPAAWCADRAYADLVMKAQAVGCWDWDVLSDRCRWDAVMWALFGMTPMADPITLETAMQRIHQDDRPGVRERIIAGLESAGPWSADFRVVLASGQVRWITAQGRFVRNHRGRPVRLFGVCIEKPPASQNP